MTTLTERVDTFWGRFIEHQDQVIAAVTSRDDRWLCNFMSPLIKATFSPDSVRSVNWEIGPGSAKDWQLALSPVVRENLRLTSFAVSRAPAVDRWEWYPYKPRKRTPSFDFSMSDELGESVRVDASTWAYIIRRGTLGSRNRILFVAPHLTPMTGRTKTEIAWLLLDNIVGELDSLSVFEEAKVIQVPAGRGELPTLPIQNLVAHVESLRGAAQQQGQSEKEWK